MYFIGKVQEYDMMLVALEVRYFDVLNLECLRSIFYLKTGATDVLIASDKMCR